MFEFVNVDFPEPVVEETEFGRFYSFNGNKYPSITTVLGATADKTGLDEWRRRIGNEEATRVSVQATKHGSELHLLMENFIYGNEIPKASFKTKQAFNLASRAVSKRISVVYGVESALYSDRLKVAGRTDLICKFDSLPSIVDWKTSKEPGIKNKEFIIDYCIQTAFYANCVNELNVMPEIKQGVLVFCNPFQTYIDTFNISEYNKLLNDRVNEYYGSI